MNGESNAESENGTISTGLAAHSSMAPYCRFAQMKHHTASAD